MMLTIEQAIIGMKNAFQGIVVREWAEENEEQIDFHEHNKVIVKMCVKYYHNMQKLRYV